MCPAVRRLRHPAGETAGTVWRPLEAQCFFRILYKKNTELKTDAERMSSLEDKNEISYKESSDGKDACLSASWGFFFGILNKMRLRTWSTNMHYFWCRNVITQLGCERTFFLSTHMQTARLLVSRSIVSKSR